MTTTFFEIPDDGELMAKLVEAIPSIWSCMDGELTAPMSAVIAGKALAGTGIILSRFDGPKATIAGRRTDGNGRLRPDLVSFFVDRLAPAFVEFDEAGFERNEFAFGQAKRIAAGFLRQGYRGWFRFYNGFHRDHKYDNASSCDLRAGPWTGAPCMDEEAGRQPPRLKLEWEQRYGGTKECVAAIEAACATLGLRAYEPAPLRGAFDMF